MNDPTADGTHSALADLAALTNEGNFQRLAESHRRELLAYCYRMLGSLHDAEDALQETLFRAWRRRDTYAGHAPLRAWLYRIATNTCLDALRRRQRRILPTDHAPAATSGHEPPRVSHDLLWLEPYPSDLLEERAAGPDAIYALRESVALAFLAAVQYLPARQRAVLILRDVLGWSAADVAGVIDSSLASVTSALQRARATLKRRYPAGRDDAPDSGERAAAHDDAERRLVDRYVRAWEDGDLNALVALLREDVIVSMPPDLLWFNSRDTFAEYLANTILAGDARGRVRLQPVAANLQPAFALYLRDGESYRALGITVLALESERIAAITGFMSPSLFPRFGVEPVIAT